MKYADLLELITGVTAPLPSVKSSSSEAGLSAQAPSDEA